MPHRLLWQRRVRFRLVLSLASVCWLFGSFVATRVSAAQSFDEEMQAAISAAIAKNCPSLLQLDIVGGDSDPLRSSPGPFTGTLISESGLVVTSANFFVKPFATIAVTSADGMRIPAKLLARDYARNLALLQVDKPPTTWQPVPSAPFASVRVGQTVVALGRTLDVSNCNASVGIVSATSRLRGRAMQIDAKTSPANYGGMIVDLDGNPMGLIVPLSPESNAADAGVDWYDSGVGFAIPWPDVTRSISRMQAGGDLKQGLVGIGFPPNATPFAKPLIGNIRPGSPAANAGLKKGDLILRLNEMPVQRVAQFEDALGYFYSGDIVEIGVRRGGLELVCRAELTVEFTPYVQPALGVLPHPQDTGKRLTIGDVANDGPADTAGLQPGDVIESIQKVVVEDWGAFEGELAEHLPGDIVELQVRSDNGEPRTIQVKLGEMHAAEWVGEAEHEVASANASTAYIAHELKHAEFGNKCSVLIPGDSNFAMPLLVWLPEPGPCDLDKFIEALGDSAGFGVAIMVLESSDSKRWQIDEVEAANDFVALAKRQFKIDSTRVAAGGAKSGATFASLLAFQSRPIYRGLILIDGGISDRLSKLETIPVQPLLVWVGRPVDPTNNGSTDLDFEKLESSRIPFVARDVDTTQHATNIIRVLNWVKSLNRL